MDKKKFNIEILESYSLPKFLLYLLEHPEGVQKVDLRLELGLASTTSARVPKLAFEEGLITTKPDLDRVLFVLTEKGQQIAEHLQKIEELLNQKT